MARKLCILVAVLVPALPAGVAHAATFPVNSTADEVDLTPGDNLCLTQTGTCTLRAATQQANASAGDDVINLPAGDYGLTIGGADEDASATGDLDLNPSGATPERVTITGAGARTTRIIGVAGDRVLNWTDDNIIVDISGVTITGGSGASFGAGIDGGGTFTLTNVAVTGNHADNPATLHNQGGGIFNQGGMTLVNVTLSGNSASGPGNPQGGGLFDLGTSTRALRTSRCRGTAWPRRAVEPAGRRVLLPREHGNHRHAPQRHDRRQHDRRDPGRRPLHARPDQPRQHDHRVNRTAGASPAVSNCAGGGGDSVISLGHNLDEGSDCNFTAATDLRDTDPLLGPLQDNGGQLDTRALLLGSPAIDTGDAAACPATDARGIARPSGAGFDIGAFEFFVPPPPPPDTPTAVLGRLFVAQVVSGTVTIATRVGGPFTPLGEATEIPAGSFLNTRRGTVRLTAATNTAGKTQSGNFSRGLFQAVQSRRRSAKGLTELRLKGGSFGVAGRAGGRERPGPGRTLPARDPPPAVVGAGSLPHQRPQQLGDRPRHDLGDDRPLRRHAHQGEPRPGRGARLPPQEDRARPRREELSGEVAPLGGLWLKPAAGHRRSGVRVVPRRAGQQANLAREVVRGGQVDGLPRARRAGWRARAVAPSAGSALASACLHAAAAPRRPAPWWCGRRRLRSRSNEHVHPGARLGPATAAPPATSTVTARSPRRATPPAAPASPCKDGGGEVPAARYRRRRARARCTASADGSASGGRSGRNAPPPTASRLDPRARSADRGWRRAPAPSDRPLRRPLLALVHLGRREATARQRDADQQQAAPRARGLTPAGRSSVATAVSSTISKLSEPPSSSAASEAIVRPRPRFLT